MKMTPQEMADEWQAWLKSKGEPPSNVDTALERLQSIADSLKTIAETMQIQVRIEKR